MSLSRREFLGVSAAAVAVPVLGSLAMGGRREATFYQWTEVAPGLWAGQTRTGDNLSIVGGNALLVTHADGGLLIDTMQAVLGNSLRREALTKTGKITHVINTHHHFDHAGGNHAFTADTVVSGHPKCRERLLKDFKGQVAQVDQKIAAIDALGIDGCKAAAEDARKFKESLATLKPDAFACTQTIEGGKKLDLSGRSIEVFHVGAGHTDNDLFMFFPKENVLVTGDLVFHRYHPYFDPSANASSVGWQASLRRALEVCNEKTVVIPGHGEITDRGALTRQIEYFDTCRDLVEKAMKDGKTREEIAAMTQPRFAGYKLKVAEGSVLGGLFDEATRK